MSREGLAETLLLEDKLKGLTADKAAAATKDFETLKARVGEQEAMRILEEKGAEGLEKQVGMGDKLNATMEKLKEIFVVVGEALMPVFDVLISVFKIIGPIMKALSPVFRMITLIGNAVGDVFSMLSGDFSFSGTKSAFSNMKPTDFLGGFGGMVGEFAGAPTMGELMGEEKAMATGGIVKGPTRAIIGEAGPEAVIPLSGNTPALKVDNSETNNLLKIIANKLTTVDMYEVQ